MTPKKEQICANCGLLKKQHDGNVYLDKKKGEIWKACKKFKPQTPETKPPIDDAQVSLNVPIGREGNTTKALWDKDKTRDNHSQENPNGIGKRGNAFSPDALRENNSQNVSTELLGSKPSISDALRGCGKMFKIKLGFVGRPQEWYCGDAGHLCPSCQKKQEEKLK